MSDNLPTGRAASHRVLLTGATGFVGRRLYPALRAAGVQVVCASRNPERSRASFPDREWVALDVRRDDSIARALSGCTAAYFLVHSMGSGESDYRKVELESADRFARAAEECGLARIVYLGGVAPSGPASEHLKSRLAVGERIRSGRVPALELRAGMIVGHGSASWTMVRDLAARLPGMVLPRWLGYRSEPVSIEDVVRSLVAGLFVPVTSGTFYDLPGPEALTGREVLQRTAALMGLRPFMISVPFVTPILSSYWIRLVTSVEAGLARELVQGLTADLLAARRGYFELAGLPPPLAFDEAARRALGDEARAGGRGIKAALLETAVQFAGRRA